MVPIHVLVVISVLCIFLNPSQFWGDMVSVENSDSFSRFLDDGLIASAAAPVDVDLRWKLIGATLLSQLVGFAIAFRAARLPGRGRARKHSLRLGAMAVRLSEEREGKLAESLLVGPLVSFARDRLQRSFESSITDAIWRKGLARSVRGVATHGLRYSQPSLPQVHLLCMLAGALGALWLLTG